MNVLQRYPGVHRVVRAVMRAGIHLALGILADLRIEGLEHVPGEGPLLVAANHFSFIDPLALIRAIPRPLEFLGGLRLPNAPAAVTWIPRLWGYYPVARGTGSRRALRAAEAHVSAGGALALFPEAGSWAQVLRPARPGAAFIAVRSGARVLPVGLDGLVDILPALRRGHRARVTVRIGRPIGPFVAEGEGPARRAALDAIGHAKMGAVAALIPPERHGWYSSDPAIRAAAAGTEVYPWADEAER